MTPPPLPPTFRFPSVSFSLELRELKPGFVLRDVEQPPVPANKGKKGNKAKKHSGDDVASLTATVPEGPWDPRALIQRLSDTFYFYLFEDQLPLFVESVRIDSRVRGLTSS